jgi:hypothetical protein
MRLLLRVLRPEDDQPFLLWRADIAEAEQLIELGEEPERAGLWAALLRWSEAGAVAQQLRAQGWQVQAAPVRLTTLGRLATRLQPPEPGTGIALSVANVELRGVPELPEPISDDLRRLLAFLDQAE